MGLLLIGSAPAAIGGTADDPEISDAEGDAYPALANAYADLLAAWLEPRGDVVDVHILISSLALPSTTTAYFLVFDNNNETRFASFASTDDPTADVFFARGVWDDATGFASLDGTEATTGRLEGGEPAEGVIEIPVGDLGHPPRITNLRALVVDYKPGAASAEPIVLDEAGDGREYGLPSAPDAQETSPRADTPGPGPLTGILAAVVLAIIRRRQAAVARTDGRVGIDR